jgi:hypothetical protein
MLVGFLITEKRLGHFWLGFIILGISFTSLNPLAHHSSNCLSTLYLLIEGHTVGSIYLSVDLSLKYAGKRSYIFRLPAKPLVLFKILEVTNRCNLFALSSPEKHILLPNRSLSHQASKDMFSSYSHLLLYEPAAFTSTSNYCGRLSLRMSLTGSVSRLLTFSMRTLRRILCTNFFAR